MNKILTLIVLSLLTLNTFATTIVDLGQTTGQPASLNDEFNRLIGQINIYNTANDPDLPIPSVNNGVKTETPLGGKEIELGFNNFTGYLLFKWGNEDQFYYVVDLNDYMFQSTVTNGNENHISYLGLSHWTKWELENTSVPEAGSTLPYFGIGMLGLFLIKRKLYII